MNRKEIRIIDVLDHFTTDSNEDRVVARFIGEFVGENDDYIMLKHITSNINIDDSIEEVSKLVKKAIIQQWVGYIDIEFKKYI